MKFNKNNTCLHFLEPGATIDFEVPKRDQEFSLADKMDFKQSVIESFTEGLWKKQLEVFGAPKIQFVSRPFLLAFEKGKRKLSEVFDKEEILQSGVLMWTSGDPGCLQVTNTVFYSVQSGNVDGEWQCALVMSLFQKASKDPLPVLAACYVFQPKKETLKNFTNDKWSELKLDFNYWASFIISFACFCRYCEIETKVVAPQHKEHHAGEKYVNETKSKVEILDANWFTTIVRSEGFTVGADTGGFFRWQPCGPGQKLRQLKWIMPYEKEGYTRKAKKLLHDGEQQTE